MNKYICLVSSIILCLSGCGTNSKKDEQREGDNSVVTDSPYQCDGREYCSEMDSYEEAKYFLDHCPNVKMDGDNDGIPCERQFNK